MDFFYQKRGQELYFQISHSLAYRAHLHENIELVYLTRGTAHAFSGGKDCILTAGDFFVVFPNNIHYYDNCSDNLAILAIVSLDMLSEFRNILTTKSLVSPLIRPSHPQAGELFNTLISYDGTFKNEASRGLLLTLFSMLMENAEFSERTSLSANSISAILDFCENNYKNEISLRTISDALNISQSHISHIFTNKIHMNFRDYINSLRINNALHILKEGELNITETAFESGFDSTRTFNRVFKSKFGVSPREYLKDTN